MRDDTSLVAVDRNTVRDAFVRTLPTALAIAPVAMLCGVLSAQHGWEIVDVFLFSAFGFSGSGQLALLPLAGQGIGVLTMLLMAVSINSRYIPVAFSTANRLPLAGVLRASSAHMLGDEAYAVENERDSIAAVITIRLTIYVVWILSNVAGALLFSSLPLELFNAGVNLGLPASLVLLALSLGQIKIRVPRICSTWSRRIFEIAMCIVVALVLFLFLGKVWFWLPSIAFSTWRMKEAGA
ncbi:AzlC family ABC transporter permease [Herbaspirillum sp. NPDC087042]|uniref:AzlC family ABC transporter permease n=1 Tax=Herbaspirillum sp. NPDC087042 TaxID=3364004 RepID=UPI003814EE8B